MRHWTLAEANAELPRVRELLARIRSLAAQARQSANGSTARKEEELAEAIEELTGDGIVLRDPARGLIDFPALASSGREYLLCWLDGEESITWWHWPETGFAGRTPIRDAPE